MNSTDTFLFLKVAQTLSFKETADQLGMSRSAISKRVALLEKELGTALVNRTPRSISLTEAGQIFARHCEDIDDTIERATQAVQRRDQVPSGILRTSLPTGLGAQLMPALMTDFTAEYPDIRMVAHFGEPFVDIVTGGYDVVLRVAERLTDSALMAKRLATSPRLLVASPDYLEKHGEPADVRDLSQHKCLGLGYRSATAGQWRFVESRNVVFDVPVTYQFTSNNDLALILAACLGAGIFYTTEILVQNELKRGRLVPVLPDVCRRIQMGVFAVYPQKQPSAKVRAFIEFVSERVAELETADRWTPLREPAK
jgi:DNA-binding transcriptional LysR family regulator